MSFDLDAYCRRIGYAGERAPTLEALRALHRLHPQAMAFENLDPLLGRPISLDPADLQRKMLHEGRGGYCFEHNVLFGGVLRAFGFAVTDLTGRVLWNIAEDFVMPRSHMLLHVHGEGADYLADVGFGGNTLTAPLALVPGIEQPTPHEPARFVAGADEWIAEIKVGNRWRALYRFDLTPQLPIDLELANWYTATHPTSPFVGNLVAARVFADRRCGLRDNVLTVHRLNGASERTVLGTLAELRTALTDVFGIALPREPMLDRVLAGFVGGGSSVEK